MSLLNLRKKNTETKATPKKEAAKKSVAVVATAKVASVLRPHILVRPHVTEKASTSTEKGVYVFQVAMNANKREIAQAVAVAYKVTPVRVTTVAIPRKLITVKGKIGFRKGGKKAYVYLKKGEKIEIM